MESRRPLSPRFGVRYQGQAMNEADGIDHAERTRLWERLDGVLPKALALLREALKRRVVMAPQDPLRNRLVHKLLVGIYAPTQLIAQFENAAAMLRNWDVFVAEMAGREGAAFDTRLWPWLAELRALDFLRKERAA